MQSLLKINEESHVVSEEIEIYSLFYNNILPIFNNSVKKIENNSTTVIELFSIILNLKTSLLSKKIEEYFDFLTNQKQNNLQDKNLKSTITRSLNLFYDEALKYLNNHFDFDELFDEIATVQSVFKQFNKTNDWENAKTIPEKWNLFFRKILNYPTCFYSFHFY